MMSNVSLNDRTVENETTTATSTIRLSSRATFYSQVIELSGFTSDSSGTLSVNLVLFALFFKTMNNVTR